MAARYLTELFTADVLAAQQTQYGRQQRPPDRAGVDALGPDEQAFIARRDSFYLGTVSSAGWPYVQHRGGPAGFLKVIDPHRLGFADLKGNRQLASVGNVASSDRVSLLLMDYPGQQRLKILGHARFLDARAQPELADALSPAAELRARVERLMIIDVVGFDWNCPAYITPRYTQAEVEEHVAALRARIAELEARAGAGPDISRST